MTDDIRLAHEAEQAAVVACVRAAYAPYVARIGREPAPMGADYASLIARGVVYVLPDDEMGVRGVLVMEPVDGALFIENVAVQPRVQGRGLGRRLMAFAEQRARTLGLSEIQLYTANRGLLRRDRASAIGAHDRGPCPSVREGGTNDKRDVRQLLLTSRFCLG